jgi:two-component system, chemotaxis family, chemotaxis protein CheY
VTACTVLVVDDDDDIREAIAEVLDLRCYAVLQARDGADAMRLLSSATALPRLIFLDLMMPVMDGFEFRKRQRGDERLRDIPVVILSADSAAQKRTKELDAAACYVKPVSIATLISAVVRYC